jgi:hypothetical protein
VLVVGVVSEEPTLTVAALFVERDGVYSGLHGVEVWDLERDARLYEGPWPVVAHPPCNRWCMLASVNEARWGTPIGDDGGCFYSALDAVRIFGGVLEHPAYTLAWDAFGLPRPARGFWRRSLLDGGYVTEISQVAYGHTSRKRTWLYYVGDNPPPLDWSEPPHLTVVGAGVNSGESAGAPRHELSLRTPLAFRDVLLDMARGATRAERSVLGASEAATGTKHA